MWRRGGGVVSLFFFALSVGPGARSLSLSLSPAGPGRIRPTSAPPPHPTNHRRSRLPLARAHWAGLTSLSGRAALPLDAGPRPSASAAAAATSPGGGGRAVGRRGPASGASARSLPLGAPRTSVSGFPGPPIGRQPFPSHQRGLGLVARSHRPASLARAPPLAPIGAAPRPSGATRPAVGRRPRPSAAEQTQPHPGSRWSGAKSGPAFRAPSHWTGSTPRHGSSSLPLGASPVAQERPPHWWVRPTTVPPTCGGGKRLRQTNTAVLLDDSAVRQARTHHLPSNWSLQVSVGECRRLIGGCGRRSVKAGILLEGQAVSKRPPDITPRPISLPLDVPPVRRNSLASHWMKRRRPLLSSPAQANGRRTSSTCRLAIPIVECGYRPPASLIGQDSAGCPASTPPPLAVSRRYPPPIGPSRRHSPSPAPPHGSRIVLAEGDVRQGASGLAIGRRQLSVKAPREGGRALPDSGR
ncbi:hypothetical protein chiPu_0024904 [Chiloscyllium punctatum]|uniref:Uncharacterized protein n=1 Tax=Chiloscyllium punctatum TaxID=137246 RepID=A0A401TDW3_CHIPU|nr:hypothetical protein [Chiloscyllium punctatum]